MINYFDNFNFFSFDCNSNNYKDKYDIDLNDSNNAQSNNNSIIEKNIKVKKRVINNNINLIKNDNYNLKEINLEYLYLILKKFEIIKNNITLLKNLKNRSSKQLIEYINMTRIFIYDHYKFYLNSSFE